MKISIFILFVVCVLGAFASANEEHRRYDVRSQQYADALKNEVDNFMKSSSRRHARPHRKNGIHSPPVIAQADLNLINSFENRAKEFERRASSRDGSKSRK